MSLQYQRSFQAASLACLLAVVLPGGPFASGAPAEPGPREQVRADAHGDPLPPGALLRLGTVRWRAGARFLAFLPDGKTLATAEYRSADSVVRFWDAATGKESGHFSVSGAITAFALSPDGKTLALNLAWDSKGVVFVSVPDGKEVRRFEETSTYFHRLLFSPDGKTLAALGNGGGLHFWDVETGKSFPHQQQYDQDRDAQLAFSPDGKTLAVSGSDRTLRLLEAATGKELFRRQAEKGDGGRPVSVSFSPDGKKLVWRGEDPKTFALWDASKGEAGLQFRGHPGTVLSAVFSPDGKRIASTGAKDDGSIRLWDAETGKELRKVAPPSGAIDAFVFSPDGKRLASADDDDGVVHLWDVETGKELTRIGEHQGRVCSVGFSPDGRTAYTGCADRVVRVWDADKGTVVRRVEVGGGGEFPSVYDIVFSNDRKAAAVTRFQSNADLWDLDSGKWRASLDGGEDKAWTALFAPDGKTLVSRGFFGTGIQFWDAGTGKKVTRIPIDDNGLGAFAVSPDGKTLVAERNFGQPGEDRVLEMSLWDVALGKELRKWSLSPERAGQNLRFSPDGRKIAMAGAQGAVLWDAASGKELPPLLVPKGSPAAGSWNCLAFSPDGKTLALGGQAGVLYLWEVSTARTRAMFLGHRAGVTSLDFSPDGARLLSGSSDTTALLWDLTGLTAEGKPAKALAPEDMATLWEDLADVDAGKAWRAGWRLAADPEAGVPFLRKHVRPEEIDTSQIPKWLAALGGDDFEEREEATRRLAKLGDAAGPALRKALEGKLSSEAHRRVEELLDRPDRPVEAEEIRALRCVEVLEHIGSAEARRLLDELGRGTPGVRLTREAKAALERLAKRSSGRSDP